MNSTDPAKVAPVEVVVEEREVTPGSEIESSEQTAAGNRISDSLLLLISFIAFIAAWEIAVRVLEVSPIVLPTPSRIVSSLWGMVRAGTIWRHFGVTMVEIIGGFIVGSALGIALGTLIAHSRLLDKILYPYIVAMQTIPKVAIAPLMIIWFGFGLESKIMIAVLISFFPLLVNTIVGLRNVQPEYLDLMTALTATRLQAFRFVRFPNALPFIFAGLEASIVLSVIGAIVGEFVGAGVGLGYLIMLYNSQLNVPGVFAVILLLSGIGILLHALMVFLRRRVVFWSETDRDRFTGA